MGFTRALRDRTMLRGRYHALIDGLLVRMEGRVFPVDLRNIRPELLTTVAAPIAHMKRHDLAGGRIHRAPDPWLVGLVLYEAPHCIRCGFQTRYQDLSGRPGACAYR